MPRKRSNPTRNVPHPKRKAQVNAELGDMKASRSRSDFAGSNSRKRRRGVIAPAELGVGGDRRRTPKEMQKGWAERGRAASTIPGANGSLPTSGLDPKPLPMLVLYSDLVEPEDFGPEAVYGQYPRGLIGKILPWMKCERHEILHICSGSLPEGEGIRVDIRPAAKPDYLADGRKLPFAKKSIKGAMIDPPYSDHYARVLYGVDYPRPSHLLREAARVVRPGGRIVIVHYITPKPVKGTTFVKAFGLSTGFDMPMRAVSIYEVDQEQLPLIDTSGLSAAWRSDDN